VLPEQLDVGGESRHEYEVQLARAEDLVGDVGLPASRVPGFGPRYRCAIRLDGLPFIRGADWAVDQGSRLVGRSTRWRNDCPMRWARDESAARALSLRTRSGSNALTPPGSRFARAGLTGGGPQGHPTVTQLRFRILTLRSPLCSERTKEETHGPHNAAEHRRSSAFASHAPRLPLWPRARNKGRRYPADPPRVEEIVAVMRQAGERPAGLRLSRSDRCALARRPSDQRGPGALRGRP
jgi:hypothetical protein